MGIQIQKFYNGVSFSAKQLINAFVGGSTNKTPQQVYEMIEQAAMNSNIWGGQRVKPKYVGDHNVDAITAMEAKLPAMIEQKMGNITSTPSNINPQQIMFFEF